MVEKMIDDNKNDSQVERETLSEELILSSDI
jgi:hypothetical protein